MAGGGNPRGGWHGVVASALSAASLSRISEPSLGAIGFTEQREGGKKANANLHVNRRQARTEQLKRRLDRI